MTQQQHLRVDCRLLLVKLVHLLGHPPALQQQYHQPRMCFDNRMHLVHGGDRLHGHANPVRPAFGRRLRQGLRL